MLETTHPPVYYLPPACFTCAIEPARGGSFCEWKGRAIYWSLREGDKLAEKCAWSYPDPSPAFAAIRDHLAVYPQAMDACFVDDEQVTPPAGRLLWRLDHQESRRPVQGRRRNDGLVNRCGQRLRSSFAIAVAGPRAYPLSPSSSE